MNRASARRLIPAMVCPLEARRLLAAEITLIAAPPFPATGSKYFLADLATFAPPAGTTQDDFVASVDWGDGSAIQPAGVFDYDPANFVVKGMHLYRIGGTYQVTVAVQPLGGVPAVVTTTANVANGPVDNTLTGALDPASDTGVAGDGITANRTPTYRGTVLPGSQLSLISVAPGAIQTLGSTTADAAGRWAITSAPLLDGTYSDLFVTSVDPTAQTFGRIGLPTLVVAAAGPDLAGALDPASDSGFAGDGITNARTPTFRGTTAPGAPVSLVAIPAGSSTPLPLGATTADATGRWAMTAPTLPDGSYAVVASATDPTAGSIRTLPLAPLVVDTAGPTLGTLTVDRARGRFTLTVADPGSGPDLGGLLDSAGYRLRPGSSRQALRLAGVAVTWDASGTTATITGRLPQGRRLPAGPLNLLVRASVVRDRASNTLAGGDATLRLPAGRRVLAIGTSAAIKAGSTPHRAAPALR